MKVTRIELDLGGIQNRLDNHVEMMKEQDEMLTKIYTDVGKVNTEIASLKGGTAEVKAIVANLKATQSDHGELIKSNEKITHEVRNTVDRIEEHMYKQDDRIMQIEGYMIQILERLPKTEGE
jgi:methyl-accepting chemotaxis protein